MADTSDLEYGALQEEDSLAPALGALLTQALHFNMTNPEDVAAWMSKSGLTTFRYVRRGDKLAAGLKLIEMGQWFGGVNVPIAGITVVGVAPEHRGAGVGAFLMNRMHEEVYAKGFSLAVLFPATVNFYRSVGYERAGAWDTYEIPTEAIHVRDYSLEVVPVGADRAIFEPIYTERARRTCGNLARSDGLWTRALEPKGQHARHYLVQRDGQPEGYVAFFQKGQFEAVQITDLCALTRDAARRLLTFFADFRSIASPVRWHGGPQDPWLFLLPEQKYKLTESVDWMVRVLDVAKALTLRGYPKTLRAELHLDIADSHLPWNNGRFVLEVADGSAEVRKGGEGRLRLGIRELAALYTGHLTPAELRAYGNFDGPDSELAAAGLLFSGSRPWMPDIF